MMRMTLAAAVGAVLVQAVEVLQAPDSPRGGLTPEERAVLSHVKLVYAADGQGRQVPTILFEGVNVQIANGLGSMQSTNGRGNLIVGYQVQAPFERTGSHNLVIGGEHTYTSYGGIVSGEANELRGPNSVAVAGLANVVRGERCAVVGGLLNDVSGADNVVLAGDGSTIGSGAERCALVSSWDSRIEDGDANVILGGQVHRIEGGSFNALVAGVGHHLLACDQVGIVSGDDHELFLAQFAAVLGGMQNSVGSSYHSALVGGFENSVTADLHGCVVGGQGNEAQGRWSTVGGGLNRTAAGDHDWVAGGLFQDQ